MEYVGCYVKGSFFDVTDIEGKKIQKLYQYSRECHVREYNHHKWIQALRDRLNTE